ncbi:hypothetical protein NQ317_019232 [Molorchus minor]|uniref:Uncharacterized protein n=1 Tax=Molorchus minor TaxID=1323400 RepID=A0ABQ9JST9_9CUCU|nr:hypothetical protein NQ317_019232 [Molorchus minor]
MNVERFSKCCNVDVIYNEIFSHCETIINNISPILTCKYNNNVPWFDNDIFYAINLRDKSYKAFKGSTGNDRQEKWDIFKQRRNMTKKERYYFEKNDRYSNNSQLMWKTLKKLVNISYNEFPKRIEFNNSGNINVVPDITEISNKLNNYFVCSVKEIVNSINQDEVWSYCDYNLYACFAEFSLYLNVNKLKLNVNKTKGMIITTKYKYSKLNLNDIRLHIDNELIELGNDVKYLGFKLDSCLLLGEHFNYILKKISKKNFLFFTNIFGLIYADQDKAPLYFQEFIKFNSDIHDYPTRFNSNIHIQRTNKRNSMISLFFKGFDQYNKLPVDIKCSKSLAFFKKKALERCRKVIFYLIKIFYVLFDLSYHKADFEMVRRFSEAERIEILIIRDSSDRQRTYEEACFYFNKTYPLAEPLLKTSVSKII